MTDIPSLCSLFVIVSSWHCSDSPTDNASDGRKHVYMAAIPWQWQIQGGWGGERPFPIGMIKRPGFQACDNSGPKLSCYSAVSSVAERFWRFHVWDQKSRRVRSFSSLENLDLPLLYGHLLDCPTVISVRRTDGDVEFLSTVRRTSSSIGHIRRTIRPCKRHITTH